MSVQNCSIQERNFTHFGNITINSHRGCSGHHNLCLGSNLYRNSDTASRSVSQGRERVLAFWSNPDCHKEHWNNQRKNHYSLYWHLIFKSDNSNSCIAISASKHQRRKHSYNNSNQIMDIRNKILLQSSHRHTSKLRILSQSTLKLKFKAKTTIQPLTAFL